MKYYCNKRGGLKLKDRAFRNGDQIPKEYVYPKLIDWGWIRVEGTGEPKIISNDLKQKKHSPMTRNNAMRSTRKSRDKKN